MDKYFISLAIFCPVMLIFSADLVVSATGIFYTLVLLYVYSRTIIKRVRKEISEK